MSIHVNPGVAPWQAAGDTPGGEAAIATPTTMPLTTGEQAKPVAHGEPSLTVAPETVTVNGTNVSNDGENGASGSYETNMVNGTGAANDGESSSTVAPTVVTVTGTNAANDGEGGALGSCETVEVDWSPPESITIQTIEDGLSIFVDDEHAVELRALNVDYDGRGYTQTWGGYFDRAHLHEMAVEAGNLSGRATGVYFTLNPLNPALLARTNNRVKRSRGDGDGATDKDVTARRFILFDVDPVRPAGVPATDAEKAQARVVIIALMGHLKALGWPDPIVADSGNGYHLIYRVDLPVDDGGLVKRCLQAAAGRFDTAAARVDQAVFNPSRICKLYGTTAAKGDGSEDRPHRPSALLKVPDVLMPVPKERLEALVAEAPADSKATAAKPGAVPKPAATPRPPRPAGGKARAVPIVDRARAYLAQMPPAVQGENGSGQAFAAACALVVGFDLPVDEALPLFREYSDRCQPPWSEKEILHKLEDAARKAEEQPERVGYLLKEANGEGRADGKGGTDAATLIALATADVELFHAPDGMPYATIPVGGHHETHPLGSKAFKLWLAGEFYDRTGRAPNPETFRAALGVLELAASRGPTEPVFVRVAEVANSADPDDPTLYLDLANAEWQAVEITRRGWQVVDRPPVRFRRPKGMRPLPAPERGGSLDDLRAYVNVKADHWPLYRAFVTAAVRPHGPYVILAINGEQGSAKTTTSKVARLLVDPHVSPLRSPPRDERDLMIAATNGGMLGYDNLSYVPDWLSDGLCRVATGGGMATRQLYSDDEEVHFAVQRPIIINGIEDVASRGDLLDRCLVLDLPEIPEGRRKEERAFWAEFRAAHARLLGGLLDAVVGALDLLPTTNLSELPRMADFARWGEAVSRAGGAEPGVFLSAYAANRAEATAIALEASPVAAAVRTMMDGRLSPWTGTAQGLLVQLGELAEDSTRRSASWPKSPRGLAGALRRVMTGLRSLGIRVEFTRTGPARLVTLANVGVAGHGPPDGPVSANPTTVIPTVISEAQEIQGFAASPDGHDVHDGPSPTLLQT